MILFFEQFLRWCSLCQSLFLYHWHKTIEATVKVNNHWKNTLQWEGISLIAEWWLCMPFWNATLDRFFSYMNKIKTDKRNHLSPSSLNAILQIDFLVTPSKNITRNMCLIALYISTMLNINLLHKRKEKEYQKCETENHSTYKNFICVLLKETTYFRMS